MRSKRLDIIVIVTIFVIVILFTVTAVKSGHTPSTPEHSVEITEPTVPPITQPTTEPTTIPSPSEAPAQPPLFAPAPEGYFSDALFIGDSRTVGLFEYGTLTGADYFASNGMSVYNLESETVSVPGVGRTTFSKLLTAKQYGKIYIMTGINELGYDMQTTLRQYEAILLRIRTLQPNAIIFIEANLHVTAKLSNTDKVYNNKKINNFNQAISEFADATQVFYLDVNQIFDDAEGNLNAKYTYDDTHLLGKYYKQWSAWLAEHAVLR